MCLFLILLTYQLGESRHELCSWPVQLYIMLLISLFAPFLTPGYVTLASISHLLPLALHYIIHSIIFYVAIVTLLCIAA